MEVCVSFSKLMHRRESLPYLFDFLSIDPKKPFVWLLVPKEFLPFTYIFIFSNLAGILTKLVYNSFRCIIHKLEIFNKNYFHIKIKLRISLMWYEFRVYWWFSFRHEIMNEVHDENDFYYISIVKGTSLLNHKIIPYSWFKIHEKYNGICHNDSINTR